MGDMKDFIEYIDIGDNYKTPKRTRLYCDHKDCNVYIKGTEGYNGGFTAETGQSADLRNQCFICEKHQK
jgi:hypothetical protein